MKTYTNLNTAATLCGVTTENDHRRPAMRTPGQSPTLATAAAETADRLATRPSIGLADQILEKAIADARELIRLGRPGLAEFKLARAEIAARRIYAAAAEREAHEARAARPWLIEPTTAGETE